MTSYPIIFSAPMVRAIMDGRKTQTRRLAFNPLTEDEIDHAYSLGVPMYVDRRGKPSVWQKRHDKFHAGERPWLWAKETWRQAWPSGMGSTGVVYRADKIKSLGMDEYSDRHKWTPSIHMPKRASRLSLRVTDMRIERLQDISEEDAIAEGIERVGGGRYWLGAPGLTPRGSPIDAFRDLWNSINGSDAWNENPDVVPTTFETHKQNIGSIDHD